MRILLVPALLFVLNGCAALAIPPALTIASYASDGISYLATDKTLTDHMLSDALGRNCAVWRILRGRSICKDFTPQELAARAKARRELRYDEERAQVAQIEGPYSPSGAIEGTAIARSPGQEAKPPLGAGATKVTAEELAVIAPAAGGSRSRPRTLPGTARPSPAKTRRAAPRGEPRAISSILTGTGKAKPAPNAGPRRYIVFGSFRNKRAAARLARRHRILDPFVVPARVRGATYYRVVTRPEGRASIALAFRSLKRAGVGDAYAIRACRAGRVNARCLRQVPRRGGAPLGSFGDLPTPKKSALPGPPAPVAGG